MLSSHRPQTKLYSNSSQIDTIRVCQADRIESASDNHDLSMVHINPIPTSNQHERNTLTQSTQHLHIPSYDLKQAVKMSTFLRPLISTSDSFEQITYYNETKPQPERSTRLVSIDQHIAKIQTDIPIIENLSAIDRSIPPISKASELHSNNEILRNNFQINVSPIIYDLPRIDQIESSDEQSLKNFEYDDYRTSPQTAQLILNEQIHIGQSTIEPVIYQRIDPDTYQQTLKLNQSLNTPLSVSLKRNRLYRSSFISQLIFLLCSFKNLRAFSYLFIYASSKYILLACSVKSPCFAA
jgi:hypothetical protein